MLIRHCNKIGFFFTGKPLSFNLQHKKNPFYEDVLMLIHSRHKKAVPLWLTSSSILEDCGWARTSVSSVTAKSPPGGHYHGLILLATDFWFFCLVYPYHTPLSLCITSENHMNERLILLQDHLWDTFAQRPQKKTQKPLEIKILKIKKKKKKRTQICFLI